MTRLLPALAVGCALAGTPVLAQQVFECDWRARLDAVPEPWSAWSRTFSNGNVRLAITDTIEPGAGAFHVVIVSPPYDELGSKQCRVISLDGSLGFSAVFFDGLNAAYDPSIGLMWDLPIQYFDGATGDFFPGMLSFTLNQATGAVGAWVGAPD